MKSYTWNSETLEEYRKDITLMSFKEMVSQIEYFVEYNCQLEDGETNEMLVIDLLSQIYNN
jgi:hypothetical protein|tara:strand:- start:61 stop:243 length:183 start_codon:yes stop_codon:yes gene_type:complete